MTAVDHERWDNGTRIDVSWELSPDDESHVESYEISKAIGQVGDLLVEPEFKIIGVVPAGSGAFTVIELTRKIDVLKVESDYGDKHDLETLLAAGGNTNPWLLRVASDRIVRPGDLVAYDTDTHELTTVKSPSTPPGFIDGVMAALEKAGVGPKEMVTFSHGSTIATNAIIERRGAKTGLVTTRGFRDVLAAGRANRPDLFNSNWDPSPPLVPRRHVLEVDERVDYEGTVLTELNEDDEASAGDGGERARRAFEEGTLDDELICRELDEGGRDFVKQGLALKAELPLSVVARILGSGSAKAVTALAWRAGLGMRTAMRLQSGLARIPPREVVNARDGVDYPLAPDEMDWQLEYFAG